MRLAVLIAVIASTLPCAAGCRLSPEDCRTLVEQMTVEAYTAADDEQHFRPAGLSRYERTAALQRRHLDRIDEESTLLPDRIGDEWMRIEACRDQTASAGPNCR